MTVQMSRAGFGVDEIIDGGTNERVIITEIRRGGCWVERDELLLPAFPEIFI